MGLLCAGVAVSFDDLKIVFFCADLEIGDDTDPFAGDLI